jgi:DUF1680 family protein
VTDQGNSPGRVPPTESGRMRVVSTPPLDAATVTGGLLGGRQEVNGTTSIPHGAEKLERAGTSTTCDARPACQPHLRVFRGPVFMDSDIYKWLEAVAWEYGRAHERSLLEGAEEAITLIETAQQRDGYLNAYSRSAPTIATRTSLRARAVLCRSSLPGRGGVVISPDQIRALAVGS